MLGTNDDFDESDYIEVQVFSDSPIDPTSFSIDITTTAPGFDDPPELGDIPDAQADEEEVMIPLDIPIVPNVRVFSRTDHTAPYVPMTSPDEAQT